MKQHKVKDDMTYLFPVFMLGLIVGAIFTVAVQGYMQQKYLPKPKDCFFDFDISYQCQEKVSALYPNATAFLTPTIVNGQKEWMCCLSRSQPYDFGCVYSVKAC